MPFFDNDLDIHPHNEFFIAIGKQGIHSFMMLGVVDNVGQPRLLAKVGKTNGIDPDFNNPLKMTGKALSQGSLAHVGGEWMGSDVDIAYQAYSINFAQAKGFLGMLHDLEQQHLQDPIVGPAIHRQDLRDQKIWCYVPTVETKEQVHFHYQELSTLSEAALGPNRTHLDENTVKQAQKISISNTCRTTALNLVENILGFATNISKYFFIAPAYQTHLQDGNVEKSTFYILPPPPEAFIADVHHKLSTEQLSTLKKLYQRLEDIPKSHRDDPATREKFDQLKTIYNELAGQNQLSAEALLNQIVQHEINHRPQLFAMRAPGFVSRLFSCVSTTEKMFNQMKTELQQKKDEDALSSPSDNKKPSM